MNPTLGTKIKQLRLQKGVTQEAMAKALHISCQTVSKWENDVSMPDIQLLPPIAVYFGCRIDDLFDFSEQAQFDRIAHMLEMQETLTAEEYRQAELFLKGRLEEEGARSDALRLLAELFNHRADAWRRTAEFYAREALEREPEVKQNHDNLRRAQEGTVPDWNAANHSRRIAYYQQFVRCHPAYTSGYLWLLDELLADGRLEEAQTVCDALQRQDHSCRAAFYQGRICWQRGDRDTAQAVWDQMLTEHSDDWLAFACMADAMAGACRYDEALQYARKAQQLQPSPKYVDAQVVAAQIHEILKDYEQAIESRREQLALLKQEWGLTEGRDVDFVLREIDRLRQAQEEQLRP